MAVLRTPTLITAGSLGFNATNLQQVTNYIFNTTPNATVAQFGAYAAEGALWMGGNGLCVDANTNLYSLRRPTAVL
jgi:hypothetical protein